MEHLFFCITISAFRRTVLIGSHGMWIKFKKNLVYPHLCSIFAFEFRFSMG